MSNLEALRLVGQAAESSKRANDIGTWIGAVLAIVLTVALVLGVRWVTRTRDPIGFATDPAVRTRARILQRLLITMVIIVGVTVAVAQFLDIGQAVDKLLASTAILTIIVGFAARTVLANSIAGLVLTITQPVRVGDQVRIGDHEGVVEDVTLAATVLRTIHGTNIRVPNEQIAQSVVYNDTIAGGGVVPEATALLPLGARVADAVDLAADLPGVTTARLAAIEVDGWNRIMIRGERCAPGDKVPAEARLRLALVEALREADFLVAARPADGPAQEHPPRP